MEICYKRDPRGSFMVAEGSLREETYEDIMLRENNVRCILNFYSAAINSRQQYWYNISGKISLNDYLDEENISMGFVINLFEAINFAYGRIAKFLIDPSHIFLTPDSLFLDQNRENLNVYLCYMPFDKEGERDGFSTITESLTDKVRTGARFSADDGEENQRMIELIYRLYDISLRDEFCLDRLMTEVRRYEETDEIQKIETVPKQEPEPEYNEESKSAPIKKGKEKKAFRKEEKFEETGFDIYEEETEENDFFSSSEDDENEDIISGFIAKIKAKFSSKKKPEDDGLLQNQDEIEEPVNEKLFHVKKSKEKSRHEKPVFEKHSIKPKFERKPFRKSEEDFDDVDFVYHEDDEINEPTVLLSQSGSEAIGKLVYEGPGDEEDFVINKDLVKIGSSSKDNDLVLSSNVISRHHAKITRDGGNYFIEDLNSTNGTKVNGEILSYKELLKLNRMDEIEFADVVYKFV